VGCSVTPLGKDTLDRPHPADPSLPSVLSHQAGAVVKQEGKPNDLIERIRKTSFFEPILDQLEVLMDPATFFGRSPEIVDEVLEFDVKPALEKYESAIGRIGDADLSV